MFWIRPAPHPLPSRLKIPGFDATISKANGLLAFPSTETIRKDGPSGAESGISASTKVLVAATILTGVVTLPFFTTAVVDVTEPNLTPRMVNSAPLAIAPPASVVGILLAELITPFWAIPGCAEAPVATMHASAAARMVRVTTID
jgi:hypothetical protein